jgi:DNA-binding NtrC family response regulator
MHHAERQFPRTRFPQVPVKGQTMHQRPQVAIISPNQSLVDEISNGMGHACSIVSADTCDEMRSLLRGLDPGVLVADARDAIDGGHALACFLEQAEKGAERRRILVVTGSECPEPIARHIACSTIESINDPQGIVPMLQRMTGTTQAPPRPAAAPVSFGASESTGDAEVVLQGVTRQFETNSAPLKAMLEDLAVAAEHDVTILLVGETGSGKTFLSRLIHEASPRRNEPFLPVACGALPSELIETELFGHAKGSFTSAHADKEGKFVAARKGTVLLDEIDVLGPEQQVKLLRVIETGEFEPVGSNQTLKSQARLVVASNLDLQPLVDQGRFRPDLYYRLSMLKFEIPPLRRRRMDIAPLAKQFIRKFQHKHGISIARIDDSLLEALVGYPWPGNVRELENVIQRAVIYCRDGKLSAKHLPSHILAGAVGPTNDPSVRLDRIDLPVEQSLSRQVALTEKEIIEQALLENNYSKTRTAEALGISRVTLYNKLKKYDVAK